MKTTTIREKLIDNLRLRKEPYNINQLVEASGVARDTIKKMEDGDYGNVRYASIRDVFKALGYDIAVCIVEKEKAAQR